MDYNYLFNTLLSLLTLTILEIILGIDNMVFLAIMSQRLPLALQSRAQKLGLTLAWMTRLTLLAFALWLVKLKYPIFYVLAHPVSLRDIVLLAGGLFLLAKATQEIHHDLEMDTRKESPAFKKSGFFWVVIQIGLLDIIFSLDSVLTAIGLTDRYWIMMVAISIAIILMMFASKPLSRLIRKYPSIKMLALSFLILIGMVLLADGLAYHIPRSYIYMAMGFSLFVESLNLIRHKRKKINKNIN